MDPNAPFTPPRLGSAIEHAKSLLQAEADRFKQLVDAVEGRRYPAILAAAGLAMMTLGFTSAVLLPISGQIIELAVTAVAAGAVLFAFGALTWHHDQRLKIELYRLESEMRFRHADLEAKTALRELELLASKATEDKRSQTGFKESQPLTG